MKQIWVLASILIALLSCHAGATTSLNEWCSTPIHVVKKVDSGSKGLVLVVDLTDSEALHKPAHEFSPILKEYRSYLSSRVEPDPIGLLKRQKEIFLANGVHEFVPRMEAVINGTLGQISEVTCLEAALLSEHLSHVGAQGWESEFAAYLIQKKMNGQERIRVYFQSGTSPFVDPNPTIKRSIKSDLADGWELSLHLHNHPFIFGNPAGDIAGTIIPSGAPKWGDVGTYLTDRDESGLKEARITNGFNTLRLQDEDFDRL